MANQRASMMISIVLAIVHQQVFVAIVTSTLSVQSADELLDD